MFFSKIISLFIQAIEYNETFSFLQWIRLNQECLLLRSRQEHIVTQQYNGMSLNPLTAAVKSGDLQPSTGMYLVMAAGWALTFPRDLLLSKLQ